MPKKVNITYNEIMLENKEEFRQITYPRHYYGDEVRRLFIVAGGIMLLTLTFFNHLLPVSVFMSVLIVLVVGIVAGLSNPKKLWVMILNVGISLVSFVIFEYHAATAYADFSEPLFWIDQSLALIFFIALYLATKTVRAKLLKK